MSSVIPSSKYIGLLTKDKIKINNWPDQPTKLNIIAVPLLPFEKGQYAIIDDDDYERVSKYEWYAQYDQRPKSYYALRHIKTENGWKRQTMANFILDYENEEGYSIDHHNHDTLDNTRSNISPFTNRQQNINRRSNKSKPLPVGVNFNETKNEYRVILSISPGKNVDKRFRVHKGLSRQAIEDYAIKFMEEKKLESVDHRIALNLPYHVKDMDLINTKKKTTFFYRNKDGGFPGVSKLKNGSLVRWTVNGKRLNKYFPNYIYGQNTYQIACDFSKEKICGEYDIPDYVFQ